VALVRSLESSRLLHLLLLGAGVLLRPLGDDVQLRREEDQIGAKISLFQSQVEDTISQEYYYSFLI
jgi:hypothetical protein